MSRAAATVPIGPGLGRDGADERRGGSDRRDDRRSEPRRERESLPAPLVWTFDGPFERCLDDLDDSLRRAIVLIGDVSRVALLIDLSLPALLARVRAGDRVQPAWGRFTERIAGYGLPTFPRVRHLRARGPLATLVVAYRT
jgi:hypothetical protein